MSNTAEFVQLKTAFVVIDCCQCGMLFAMTEQFQSRRHTDGQSFYCPAGHSQRYTETELEKARKEIERAKKRAENLSLMHDQEMRRRQITERQLAAQKGQATKLRKRIANGVCPCCQRSFTDLHRHMATKHPDFVEETL